MSTVLRYRWIWLLVPVLALAFLFWPQQTLVEEASASVDNTTLSNVQTLNTEGITATTEPTTTQTIEPVATETAQTPVAEATQAPATDATQAPATEDPSTVEETQPAGDSQSTGGGGKNVVQVHNKSDQRLRVRGNIQLNRIPGPTVAPENIAIAYASCTDCQTIAVALQIDLISRSASYVSPRNAAVAANAGCTRCYTVARAIQYVYSVDDPTVVPQEVRELIRAMDQELHAIHSQQVSLPEAEARIDGVINRFTTLASSLRQERTTATEDNTPNAPPPPAE